jgi:pre-mRNA-processing factor 17
VESVREKRALVVNNGGDGDMPRSRRARLKHDRTSEGPLVTSADDELSHGIWAPPSASERVLAIDSTPAIEEGIELHPRIQKERAYLAERDRQRGIMENEDNEKEKYDRMVERKMSHLLPPRLAEDAVAMEPMTIFHGDEDVDYRGRSWTSPPPGVKGADPYDVDDHACYVPKKCVFRFTGHEKGVHRIRLFPRTGHLLLSAGLDGACKVWSVEGRRCMRTYVGHSAAVRDVQFNNDGSKFVSASFDRFLRLWDVETGEVLGTYTNRRVPYVVKFYPKDDNIFVVGCSDNKIVAYDSTTGEITQEYDHHLAPVNTITFVEDNGMKVSI